MTTEQRMKKLPGVIFRSSEKPDRPWVVSRPYPYPGGRYYIWTYHRTRQAARNYLADLKAGYLPLVRLDPTIRPDPRS